MFGQQYNTALQMFWDCLVILSYGFQGEESLLVQNYFCQMILFSLNVEQIHEVSNRYLLFYNYVVCTVK